MEPDHTPSSGTELRISTAKLGLAAFLFAACGGDPPSDRDAGGDTDAGPTDTLITPDLVVPDVAADTAEDPTRFDIAEDLSEDSSEDPGADALPDANTCVSDTLICEGGNIVCPDDGAIMEECDAGAWGGCVEGGCVDACTLAESVQSNLGCEFFGVDLPTSNLAESTLAFWVTNPGPGPALVQVEDNTESIVASATVPSRGSRTIHVPARSVAVSDGGSRLSQNAYLVSSDSPVSVIQEASANGDVAETTDASLLFPVHTLGGRTAVVSWPHSVATPTGSGVSPLRSSITLVSAGDSQTTLRVTADTASGVGVLSAAAAQELVFQLERFEVLHLENEVLGGDLTGTVISSSGPVAVFASVRDARVPAPAYLCESGAAADPVTGLCCADGSFPSLEGSCTDGAAATPAIPTGGGHSSDHLQAQMPPESLLGQRFIMGANALSGSGRWRIAAPNPTQIQGSDGGGTQILDEALRFGDLAEYDSGASWTLAGTSELVAALLIDSNDTRRSNDDTGDAAIALVPPVSAFRDNYTVYVPSRGDRRSALFSVQAGHTVFGTEDCADPAPAGIVDGQAYQTIACPMEPGTHYLRSDAPFAGVLCWGNGGFGACSPIGWGVNLPQAGYDVDGDGESDGRDVCIAAEGNASDSDADGVPDHCDPDKDGDGCLDILERAHSASDADPGSFVTDLWISADGDDGGFGTEDAPFATVAAAAIASCNGTTIHLVGDDLIDGTAVFENVDVTFAGPGPALRTSDHALIVRNGSVTFDSVDIEGCAGGAIVVGAGGQFVGDDVRVSGCANGFAVAPGGTLTLNDSEVVGASGDSFDIRGGATLTNVSVTGGTGVLIRENADVVVADGLFIDAASGADICGVRVVAAENAVTIANLSVENSEGAVGAGLLVDSNRAPVLIRDGSIVDNRGANWSGIALVDGEAPLEVLSVDAVDNRSTTNAGIYCSGGTHSIGLSDVRAIRNNAARARSGIVAQDHAGALLIEHAVVIANSSGSDAGVMITDTPDLLLGNALVVGNLANGAVGVSLIRTSSSADIHNLTVSDNFSALFAPSGLFCEAEDGRAPTVRDTIVGVNTVAGVNYPVTGCSAINTMSDPPVPDVGTNLDGDPMFRSGPNGAYYLSQGFEGVSVAVDRGSRPVAEAGLSDRTTAFDDEPDTDTVDLGYHHPIGPIRAGFVDSDGDGVEDSLDNCPEVSNVAQNDVCSG